MKYFQKITLCLAAIVVVALGNNASAAAPVAAYDPTGAADLTVTDSFSSGTITVNDAAGNGTGKAVIFTGTQDASVAMDIQVGTVKVGDTAASGAKLSSGANTVESGAILEITAATTGCIPGTLEVKSGGILKVDDGIIVPAAGGSDVFSAALTLKSGAKIQLGAGSTWSKNVTVSS